MLWRTYMNTIISKFVFATVVLLSLALFSCGSESGNQQKAQRADQQEQTQLWTCPMHPEVIKEEPGECPKCGMDLVRVKQSSAQPSDADEHDHQTHRETASDAEQQLWTCPMHPDVIKEEPGECPKCGMDLVRVKQRSAQPSEQKHDQKREQEAAEEADIQLWTCGMHPEVIREEPGRCPKCGMDLVPVKQSGGKGKSAAEGDGDVLYWQAPMDPTEIYDEPGKSKMGMELIPIYESDAFRGGGTVVIDPVTVQNMNVQTHRVRRTTFQRTIRTVGSVQYNEENMHVVSTKISGWIERLHIDYTGAPVKKGQPLMEIYSPELVTTQQEYLLALRNRDVIGKTKFSSIREGAESLLRSSRQRLLNWDIPASEIKRLEENGTVQKTLTLEALARGVVIEKNVVEGLHVKEGRTVFKIADLSNVWVTASVYDNEAPWIQVGQAVSVALSYQPGDTLKGSISYIYPYLNEKARSVQVRMTFDNPQQRLKPGMYADVIIHADPIENALVVPAEAVIRSGQRNVVFVVHEGGRFQPREVTLGSEGANGLLHVKSGLLEGESIVTSAQFLIDSESRLQESIQKMLQEKRKARQANNASKSEHEAHAH